ncbi:MAG: hypothetical protein DI571_13365, partial [Arsenicicoccus sp.]
MLLQHLGGDELDDQPVTSLGQPRQLGQTGFRGPVESVEDGLGVRHAGPLDEHVDAVTGQDGQLFTQVPQLRMAEELPVAPAAVHEQGRPLLGRG